MTAFWYAVVVLLALGVLWGAKQLGRPLDHDPGPAPGERYPLWDRWSKWHLLISLAMAGAACAMGVGPGWALALTLLAGVGWEYIHGHTDRGDLLWDLVGAVAGIALCLALL